MTPDLATSELIKRLSALSREQLERLDAEELARIDSLLAETQHDRIDSLCSKKEASFEAGPLLWLTQFTKTNNPKHELQGLPYQAPFPNKTYFLPVFEAFLELEARGRELVDRGKSSAQSLFICKSREMLTSWCTVGYAVWRAQWHRYDCFIQTASLDKATELIDYASQLWTNQEPWLKERYPLIGKEPTSFELSYRAGGRVMALPSGEEKVRLFHPNLYIQDESSFLPEGQRCFDAVLPVAHEVICVSTAAPSWFADQCSP